MVHAEKSAHAMAGEAPNSWVFKAAGKRRPGARASVSAGRQTPVFPPPLPDAELSAQRRADGSGWCSCCAPAHSHVHRGRRGDEEARLQHRDRVGVNLEVYDACHVVEDARGQRREPVVLQTRIGYTIGLQAPISIRRQRAKNCASNPVVGNIKPKPISTPSLSVRSWLSLRNAAAWIEVSFESSQNL